MYSRIALCLSALFWLTMNFLLWRSEFGAGDPPGVAVPTELVWRKIMTAPDNSTLNIFHHGKNIGYCRWTTTPGMTSPRDADDGTLAPTVTNRDYRLNLAGSIALDDPDNRLQFDLGLKLDLTQEWEEASARFSTHQGSVAVSSSAVEKTIRLRSSSRGGQRTEQTLAFSDFQNPAALARMLDLSPGLFGLSSSGPAMLSSLGISGSLTSTNAATTPLQGAGLTWTARDDWLRIGHSRVRVYRVKTDLLDRYHAVVCVSRVGELLRVELPDDWVLVNDGTGGL